MKTQRRTATHETQAGRPVGDGSVRGDSELDSVDHRSRDEKLATLSRSRKPKTLAEAIKSRERNRVKLGSLIYLNRFLSVFWKSSSDF